MKNPKKIYLLLTCTVSLLTVGSSQLFAKDNHLQASQNIKKTLLAQSQSEGNSVSNVWHYLEVNKGASYNWLVQNYERAVEQSKSLSEANVNNDLWVLNENNGGETLSRQTADAGTEVLMVTWTDSKYYQQWQGSEIPVKLERTVWVTAKPQVYNFCNQTVGIGEHLNLSRKMMLDLRLTQYLGLNPDSRNPQTNKNAFVEIWVNKESLKRPCGDGNVEANSCEFDRQTIQQLTERLGTQNYPFTGLGYTYDWGNSSPVGATEFVIEASKTEPVEVQVSLVKNTEEYCNNNRL